jgi:hypothetical protein
MKTELSYNSKQAGKATQSLQPEPGLLVRTGLHSGAWYCNTCEGKVSGNQLFRPTCEYCQPA